MGKTPEFDLRDNARRNLIINGDMRIAQRGTSFPAIADAAYSLDRFQYTKSATAAIHTISQDTDVPTIAQANHLFQNSLRLNLTTPDTGIAAAEFVLFGQKIEGYNFTKIAQKIFTLSFWVKATLPGIYCVAFQNSAGDRSYVAEYTVLATDTWEKKTITILAGSPAAGGWNYGAGVGLRVWFALAAGSNFVTTANAWQTGNFFVTANQVNGVNTGATNFRITGVMVNEGHEALPFELFSQNSYVDEQHACQRYYELLFAAGAADATNPNIKAVFGGFKVEKRAAPLLNVVGTMTQVNGGGGDFSGSPGTGTVYGSGGVINAAGGAAGYQYRGTISADAEL